MDCRIVTGDKDSFQLITDRVWVKHVKTRMGQTETIDYDPVRFREEYGFEPARMVDLKALMGGRQRQHPRRARRGGEDGHGPHPALRHRGGHLSGPGRPGREARRAEKAGSRGGERPDEPDLATIRCDAPLELKLEETRWSGAFRPELYDIFLRLGFSRLIQRYGLHPSPEAEERRPSPAPAPWSRSLTPPQPSGPPRPLPGARCISAGRTGETMWVFHDAGEQSCTAYSLDRKTFSGDYDAALGTLFSASDQKVGHGIKDIQRSLLERGLPTGGWRFDTALAAYLLEATAGSYDIDRLNAKILRLHPLD